MSEQVNDAATHAVLTDEQRHGLRAVADVLLPGTPTQLRACDLDDWDELVDLALTADPRLLPVLADFGERAAQADAVTVEDLQRWSSEDCETVAFALAAAYYMSAAVRRTIGYPGQAARPIAFATRDELCSDELIEPVVSRGSVFVPTPN
jgi:hypothetical protein